MLQPLNRSVLKPKCVAQFSMTTLYASSNTFAHRTSILRERTTWSHELSSEPYELSIHFFTDPACYVDKMRYDLLSIYSNIRSKSKKIQFATNSEKNGEKNTALDHDRAVSIEIP